MKSYAFIFARGGSKGIPKKNIRQLAGKPLIVYSIKMAQSINVIDKIFVSTDDIRIKQISKSYGAEIIDRPKYLAQDDSPEWPAWQHAVDYVVNKYGDFDRFISLPATAPLRTRLDVIKCIEQLDETCDLAICITQSHNNPCYNMVKRNDKGIIKIFSQPTTPIIRRQDAPLCFNITTVACVTRPNFVMENNGIFDGITKGVEIPIENAIDLDTMLDFQIAEYLIERREL